MKNNVISLKKISRLAGFMFLFYIAITIVSMTIYKQALGNSNEVSEKLTSIVEHLALRPTVDVPVCLVLMSVVKDAERLGDYAKNLFEVSELLEKPLDRKLFSSYFDKADEKIISLIEKTRSAFLSSDEELARELSVLEREVVVNCEEAIKKLAQGNLSSNLSVCFTLIARYYKRTAAHLLNIGTAVIRPISELDLHT